MIEKAGHLVCFTVENRKWFKLLWEGEKMFEKCQANVRWVCQVGHKRNEFCVFRKTYVSFTSVCHELK